jgi:flagellar motor protein MotB
MKRLHFPFLHLIAAFVLAWSSLNAADNHKAPKAPKAPSAPAVATPPDPADPTDPAEPPEDPADADDDDMDPDADTDPVHGKLNHLQDLVEFSKRVTIRTNETARNIVVFFENAVIDGRAGQVVEW